VIDDPFMVHQVASKLTITDEQLLQLRNLYATYVAAGEGRGFFMGDDPMAPNVGDGLPFELLPWNQEPLKDPNPDKDTIGGPGGTDIGFPGPMGAEDPGVVGTRPTGGSRSLAQRLVKEDVLTPEEGEWLARFQDPTTV
jgi:hypothetical protein